MVSLKCDHIDENGDLLQWMQIDEAVVSKTRGYCRHSSDRHELTVPGHLKLGM